MAESVLRAMLCECIAVSDRADAVQHVVVVEADHECSVAMVLLRRGAVKSCFVYDHMLLGDSDFQQSIFIAEPDDINVIAHRHAFASDHHHVLASCRRRLSTKRNSLGRWRRVGVEDGSSVC
ncbi:hypothetical protein AC579_1179 [Pseudocercospora musae]|uniref:Uncharacterized protein n=1 Tax=Pseudocercospora musae TaxID=113226 RepID=A0A139HVU7_9PEZI|nr:hypothetical protein AC579_1179 [Pseudocercospora musae]